ncbi:hypothetical protein BSLG_000398 [Batrachochytrium salamandrivorans]|nr:hypothetical protein BASA60_010727 [Batrachochytrium salamandrivorans]KAH6569117.1 hypothetical protein BASA62_005069 [Batrachochytrium salamandrivorans]KAJ1344883.1 hypothetical protein BSLG_000398 [Batrachochytrium salamandrivorans]
MRPNIQGRGRGRGSFSRGDGTRVGGGVNRGGANRGGGARAVAKSGPAKGFSYALNWKPKRGARGASNNPSRGRIGKKVAHIPVSSALQDHMSRNEMHTSTSVSTLEAKDDSEFESGTLVHDSEPAGITHTESGDAVTGSDAEDSDQNDMNSDDDSEEDAQPTKRAKLARRPIKPKGKKGKIFADQSQMMDLIDSLNVKEEETIGRKLAKRATSHQLEKERNKKILQRKVEKKQEMIQIKKDLVEKEKTKRKDRKDAAAAVAEMAKEAAQLAGTAAAPKKVRFGDALK